MTVKELIEELEKYPKDSLVHVFEAFGSEIGTYTVDVQVSAQYPSVFIEPSY